MNIEAELLILKTNLDEVYRKINAETSRFRECMYDFGDEVLALMDKRAVLQAASQGYEIGTVVRSKRPLVWNGKLTDDLRIKISRITSGFESTIWHCYGHVEIKSGWSKREIIFDPSWCEIEKAPTIAND